MLFGKCVSSNFLKIEFILYSLFEGTTDASNGFIHGFYIKILPMQLTAKCITPDKDVIMH